MIPRSDADTSTLPLLDLTPAQLRLTHAIGCTDQAGLGTAIPLLTSCLQAAAAGGIPIATAWLQHAEEIAQQARASRQNLADPGRAVRLYGAASNAQDRYRLFLDWKKPAIPVRSHAVVLSALARAVIASASAGGTLPGDLVAGFRHLLGGVAAKGRAGRNAAWPRLGEDFPVDIEHADRWLKDPLLNGQAKDFVSALRHVYDAKLDAPPAAPSQADSGDADQPPAGRSTAGTVPCSEISGPPGERGNEDEAVHEDDQAPTIVARLASASMETAAAKFGMAMQWERLPPQALRALVPELRQVLEHGSDQTRTFAALSIVSLLSATPPKAALRIPLAPMQGHCWHLSLDRECLGWRYEDYRRATSSASSPPLPAPSAEDRASHSDQAVSIPLPRVLSGDLRTRRAKRPQAQDLEVLLSDEAIDVGAYGRFLRALGDPGFPPYSARFARSMGLVYLDVTGSDMAAALLTHYFSAAAPSALRYYGPSTAWVQRAVSSVYDSLGLGPAAAVDSPAGRMGSTRVLSREQARAGWSTLVTDLNQQTKHFFALPDSIAALPAANNIAVLLAEAFVIASAHRGSMLERQTWRSLQADPWLLPINDKEGEARPRLIPRTTQLASVVALLERVVNKVRRCVASARLELRSVGPLDPAMATFHASTDEHGNRWIQAQPVRASEVATAVRRHFGGEVNCGRHTWVTMADEESVNRWLVRALTGHGSDMTRAFGAETDVPMAVALDELRKAMERLFPLIFGDGCLDAHEHESRLSLSHGLSERQGLDRPDSPARGVVNPGSLLRAPTENMLVDAKIVNEVRALLCQGRVALSNRARALLSLLVFDPLPSVELALLVANDPAKHLTVIGRTVCARVPAKYFVQPAVLPLSPPTVATLMSCMKASEASSPRTDVEEVLEWLTQRWPPPDGSRRITATDLLERLVDSWRRVHWPPSLHALVHPCATPPLLSERSLHRLANQAIGSPLPLPAQTLRVQSLRGHLPKREALGRITTILGSQTDVSDSGGSVARRAAEAIKQLATLADGAGPLIEDICDAYRNSLQRTVDKAPGCIRVSSLATYHSTLMAGFRQLDDATRLRELEYDEWLDYIRAVDDHCCGMSPDKADSSACRSQAARNALSHLFRHLRSIDRSMRSELLSLLGEAAPPVPRNSASAVLMLDSDWPRLRSDIDEDFKEWPLDRECLIGQTLLMESAPHRTAEAGTITRDAVTRHGSLCMKLNGSVSHKSAAARRLVPLPKHATHTLSALASRLDAMDASKYLFRADAGAGHLLPFAQHSKYLQAALRRVAGDPHACRHSTRSYALQRLAWPGWQNLAGKLLANDASTSDCKDWSTRFGIPHWTHSLKAAVSAGHAGLQASHGYYLAAWPLISAIYLRGTLNELAPGDPLLRSCGIEPATLRKARSRARQSGQKFDEWQWLSSRVQIDTRGEADIEPTSSQVRPASANDGSDSTRLPDTEHTAGATTSGIDTVQMCRYVMLRMLGLDPDLAAAKTRLPSRLARSLDAVVPAPHLVEQARARVRSSNGQRAVDADIRRVNGADAPLVLHWLSSMPARAACALGCMLVRERVVKSLHSDGLREASVWRSLVDRIPEGLALHVRFGLAHLKAQDEIALRDLAPCLTLGPRDRDLGAVPRIWMQQRTGGNNVTRARLTSLLNLCFHALRAVRSLQRSDQDFKP